jgi:hypothetical protein
MNNRTFDEYSFEVLSRAVGLAQDFADEIQDIIDRMTDLLSRIAQLIEADNEQ